MFAKHWKSLWSKVSKADVEIIQPVLIPENKQIFEQRITDPLQTEKEPEKHSKILNSIDEENTDGCVRSSKRIRTDPVLIRKDFDDFGCRLISSKEHRKNQVESESESEAK